jgi:nucleoside-diphosphate-sugar epimerase
VIVWIDVEDLATASLKSLEYSATGHERFLLTQSSYDTQEIADVIRGKLPEKSRAPVGKPGYRIADTHYSCDSSKAQKLLGVRLKSLEESIIPLAQQLYGMEKAVMM